MEKIISLILAMLCLISLCLSGCSEQEIEPVTVGELLDLIKAEGYTNIQQEDASDYFLVDSGDFEYKDYNDIAININTVHENNSDDYISSLCIEYNDYNDEVKHLINVLYLKLTNNSEFVDLVDNELTGTKFLNSERTDVDEIKEDPFKVLFLDRGFEYSQENDNKRFYVHLFIDGLEE